MIYESKSFDNLIGIKGFSEHLLKNHFKLYQGYVTNTNKLIESLNLMIKDGKTGTPEYSEFKRRFGWEFNGMRLHELYFNNLTKSPKKLNQNSALFQKLKKDFGSIEAWEKDFKSTGAMRGIGWAVLSYDKNADKLFNIWINEHDVGHLAGTFSILIMDVFEHAFITDYGLNKADYINSFFNVINWSEVEKRFQK